MEPDQVAASFARLDPESRALLELSIVRGLPDDDIASVLGVGTARVAERREAVVERLIEDIGAEEADRDAIERILRGEPSARSGGELEEIEAEEAAPEEATADEAEPEAAEATAPEAPEPVLAEREPRRRGPLLALTGGAAIAAIVALVLALGGGDESKPKPAGTETTKRATPPPAERPARLEPVGRGSGGGTAGLVGAGGQRLRLSVRGLPSPGSGGYVVWLYDSVSRARAIGGSRSGSFQVEVRLPSGYRRYRFLDVSLEPADGNRNHSGQSVLRVPLASVHPLP